MPKFISASRKHVITTLQANAIVSPLMSDLKEMVQNEAVGFNLPASIFVDWHRGHAKLATTFHVGFFFYLLKIDGAVPGAPDRYEIAVRRVMDGEFDGCDYPNFDNTNDAYPGYRVCDAVFTTESTLTPGTYYLTGAALFDGYTCGTQLSQNFRTEGFNYVIPKNNNFQTVRSANYPSLSIEPVGFFHALEIELLLNQAPDIQGVRLYLGLELDTISQCTDMGGVTRQRLQGHHVRLVGMSIGVDGFSYQYIDPVKKIEGYIMERTRPPF